MMSKGGYGKETDGRSPSGVVPDEPAPLKELEDRLMDKLLRRVCKETDSEGSGEPKVGIRQGYKKRCP